MTALPWPTRPLGDLVEVLDHKRVPVSAKERVERAGPVPYYGAAGQVGWIDRPLFNERLLLLGEDGVQFFDPIKPKAYLIDGPSWVNNHAHVLRPRLNLVERRYLLYYLNWADYHGVANGTTRLKLTKSAMVQIPVPVPSMTQQRRIVEILDGHLSCLDAAAKGLALALQRLTSLQDHIARVELAGGFANATRSAGRLGDVGVDDGHLPALPQGWAWHRLFEIAEVVGGVTKDAKKQSDLSLVVVPYLRVANVQRGRLDLGRVTSIRVPAATATRLRLQRGDVLLNEGGDRDKLGRGWVWEGQIDGCIHQNHVFRARVRDDILDPYLLSWAANTIGGKWCERNGRQTVNLANISLSKIRLMPVPVPPKEAQPEIASRIRSAREGAERMEAALVTAQRRGTSLRRALLTAAFSGQLTGASTSDTPQEAANV